MKTKHIFSFSAIALCLAFASCSKDDPTPDTTGTGTLYNNGVFVTNEGPFGSGTGTIDFYKRSDGTVDHDIYQAKNGYPLGNIVQSMEIFNGKAYIVVNNAGKVEVADGNTIAASGTIGGFTYPRYFHGVNSSKAYVSEWGAGGTNGALKVVNLSTNMVTASIPTGKGAESMVQVGNYVYVACSGGFDNDSVVTVIDAASDAYVTTINVGANPKSMQVDANGKIWVLCGGQWDPTYTFLIKTGSLYRIDPSSNTVEMALPFSSVYAMPGNLVENSSKTLLYYNYNGGIYSQDISSPALASSPLVSRYFYGLGIDPLTDILYATDPMDYISNGKVIRYSAAGTVLDSFSAGVIPGNFCFK